MIESRFSESLKTKITQLNDNQLGERIRGTDIAYDDIAMRFLKWPKPVILKIEKAKGGIAWKKLDAQTLIRISYIQLLMSGFHRKRCHRKNECI